MAFQSPAGPRLAGPALVRARRPPGRWLMPGGAGDRGQGCGESAWAGGGLPGRGSQMRSRAGMRVNMMASCVLCVQDSASRSERSWTRLGVPAWNRHGPVMEWGGLAVAKVEAAAYDRCRTRSDLSLCGRLSGQVRGQAPVGALGRLETTRWSSIVTSRSTRGS